MRIRPPFYLSLAFLIALPFSSCVAPGTAPAVQTVTAVSSNAPRPSLQRLDNGHYQVMADWALVISGRRFLVPAGYSSNGITAPKSVKSLLGDGVGYPETWAAVFHDWCFTQSYLTRTQADDYFIQLMKDYGISPTKINLMATSVRSYTAYKTVQGQ